MDLETENRIASILMKEAAELRRQAEKEGVDAYLHKRNVRFRPNSRFLTATVLGVQQANRVAEVSEMWRVRNKELELNDKLKGTSRDKLNHGSTSSTSPGRREDNYSHRSSSTRRSDHDGNLATSSKAEYSHRSSSTRRSDHDGNLATSSKAEYSSSEDGSLKDEEIEQFLHSRAKRGRGGVGPRMDEPGPYLPRSGSSSKTRLSESPDVRDKEEWESRVLGPEKPPSLIRSHLSLEDDDDNWRKVKKVKVESSEKHSKKHARKKDKHKERKSKERKSKHKHKSRRD